MATDTCVNTTVCGLGKISRSCNETEKHSDFIAGKSCNHDTSSKKILRIHKEKGLHSIVKVNSKELTHILSLVVESLIDAYE
jgi:hypothetical protein